MQMVAVKPIARWQIWLGKWLGIVSLNLALLVLSGASVYGLLLWRATKLPAAEQKTLRNEVLVARASAKPASEDKAIEQETQVQLKAALEKTRVSAADLPLLRQQIKEGLKAELQVVRRATCAPGRWTWGWRGISSRTSPCFCALNSTRRTRAPPALSWACGR